MNVFTLHRGTTPLLVSLPHIGTAIPPELQPRFVERALASEDTDRHLDRLYDFVRDRGASVLESQYSRYVIDLNRPPQDTPMYPGVNNTELCPTHFFTGDPLYKTGQEPDAKDIQQRREKYWQPYHDSLAAELARLKSQYGYAILYDGHSIRSRLPWLFDGRLPDLNLGTVKGASCAPDLRQKLADCLADQRDFTHVADGRFQGGYITRHYGQPAGNVHAVQMEMCQILYMQESPPFDYVESIAAKVQPLLEKVISAILDWKPNR